MWGWWGGDQKKPANSVVARKMEAAKETPFEERAAKHQRNAQVRIQMQHQELDDIKQRAKQCVVNGKNNEAKTLLAKARVLESEIQMAEAKMKNAQAQTRTLATAHSNLDQVLLMDAGATELEEIAGALEQVDVAGTVHRVATAAGELDQYNRDLAAPLFDELDEPIDDDQLDDDLRQLMEEAADERLTNQQMPSAPATAAAPNTKQPAVPIKQ